MYVEKNLAFDKGDKKNSSKNGENEILPNSIEIEDENNNWSVILSPDNSISSENDESMMINISASDITNMSFSDYSLGSISNPNESMKIVTSYPVVNKSNNRRDQRLSISSNATLSNINNSTIYSTSNNTSDLADTSMNTTFLASQSFSNNSSFIIQSNENSESPMVSEDHIKAYYAQLIKTEEMNYPDGQTSMTSSPNVSQSYATESVVSQSQYIPCEVSNGPVSSSVKPVNNYVSVNNNIPNVNDVAIPTAHFMAIDSPVQTDGSYFQNLPVQNQTQYITTDQYTNTAATVQYVPSIIDTATTTNGNYVSYELNSIINQVTNPPMNVYVTTKTNPDPMNYVSSPTAIEYQRMNQPQPQPHTPTSNIQSNGQSMFYSLSNDNNSPTTLSPVSLSPSSLSPTSLSPTSVSPTSLSPTSQTYIQPPTQYVQVQAQQSQPIYHVSHENMQPVVQVQYQ